MSLSVANVITGQFSTATSGAGSKSLTGTMVGDIVLTVWDISQAANGNVETGAFESTISVADHIQQVVGGNLSALTLQVVLLREVDC
jgi:hypothetical protein